MKCREQTWCALGAGLAAWSSGDGGKSSEHISVSMRLRQAPCGPHGGPGVDGMALRCFETAAPRAWRLTIHVSAVYFPALVPDSRVHV